MMATNQNGQSQWQSSLSKLDVEYCFCLLKGQDLLFYFLRKIDKLYALICTFLVEHDTIFMIFIIT